MMAENVTPIFTPNVDKIREHLIFLFGDIPNAYHDGLIEISILTASKYFNVLNINAAVDQAAEWNNQGLNIYTCAAVFDPHTLERLDERRQEDIKKGEVKKSYRATGGDFYCSNHVWVDVDEIEDDKIPALKEKYKECPPNYYVKTSTSPARDGKGKSTSVHFWWHLNEIVDVFTADKMELANKHLIANLYGDKGTHNRTRLMRLGGTVSYPKKGYRITEIVTNQVTTFTKSHSLDEIINAYPIIEEKPLFAPAPEYRPNPRFMINKEWSVEDVKSMLTFVDPDGNGVYADWLAIGMALKDYGIPMHVFDEWSSRGSKYTGSADIKKKWDSFNGSGTTIGTLYYHAYKGGWRPKSVTQKSEEKIEKINFNHKTGEILDETVTDSEQRLTKPKFHYDNGPDIKINLETQDFVQGLLTDGTMSVVYGASNCGKTFFMSDLAFHVAQGKRWRDKRVEKGNVMYLSLEGVRGIDNRIGAYKLENKVNLDGFLRVIGSIDFTKSPDDIPQFIEFIKEANSKFSNNVRLIVIDTLSRALGGGDENSGVDMGFLVKHADLIREHTHAHICFIHHTGKDESKKARGHSSLRAAVDTEIEISRKEGDDFSSIKIQKQRDMEYGDDMYFKLKRVVLGVDKYGDEVSSCVVEPYDIDGEVDKRAERRIKSGKTKTAYDALKEAIMEKGFNGTNSNMPNCKVVTIDIFKRYLQKRGVLSDNPASQRKQFERVHDDLIENKLIVVRDEYIWIPRDVDAI